MCVHKNCVVEQNIAPQYLNQLSKDAFKKSKYYCRNINVSTHQMLKKVIQTFVARCSDKIFL